MDTLGSEDFDVGIEEFVAHGSFMPIFPFAPWTGPLFETLDILLNHNKY